MRTATYIPKTIKMGVSDYLAMSIDKGQLYFHNLKVHDDLPDWIESTDVDVSVELGYVHNYVVPSGQGISFEMNNLDPTGNFMVEILNTGSPVNYPDFLMENYSGDYHFNNKSLSDVLVTLKITPINGAATSSSKYNLKIKALNTWPNFIKSCNFYRELQITTFDYPVVEKIGPLAVWDIFRHNNVRLDVSVFSPETIDYVDGQQLKPHNQYPTGRGPIKREILMQKRITYNTEDKMFFVFPKHFNDGISSNFQRVEISVRITLQNQDGIFSIITNNPILSATDLDVLYNDYYESYLSELVDNVTDQSNIALKLHLDKSSFNKKLGNGQSSNVVNSTSVGNTNTSTNTYTSSTSAYNTSSGNSAGY